MTHEPCILGSDKKSVDGQHLRAMLPNSQGMFSRELPSIGIALLTATSSSGQEFGSELVCVDRTRLVCCPCARALDSEILKLCHRNLQKNCYSWKCRHLKISAMWYLNVVIDCPEYASETRHVTGWFWTVAASLVICWELLALSWVSSFSLIPIWSSDCNSNVMDHSDTEHAYNMKVWLCRSIGEQTYNIHTYTSHKMFSEWKQAHVGMELSKTNQTRWEWHHNTCTPSLHLVPFCRHLDKCALCLLVVCRGLCKAVWWEVLGVWCMLMCTASELCCGCLQCTM